MLLSVGALGTLAFLDPSHFLGLGALIGLGVLGGGYLVGADRVLSEYRRDLQSVHDDGETTGLLRAEVGSQVGLERPVGLPSQRSPHVRRAPVPGETPGAGIDSER
jgi:hypothetical protein